MNKEIYDAAIRIIGRAPQMETVLIRKLIKKQFEKQEILAVVEYLKEERYLDDEHYARIYADELVRVKMAGFRKITQKLMEKGIDNKLAGEIAKEAIEDNGGEELIREKYILKHSGFFRRNIELNNINKMKSRLYNNGFNNFSLKDIPDILKED